jgi:hypothetical protein
VTTADRQKELLAAIDLVREAGLDPDSPGGAAALSHILDGSREQTAAIPASGAPSTSTLPPAESGDPVGLVAAWAQSDQDRLADLIEFSAEGARLRIPVNQLPKSKAKRQRVLTLLKLAIDRVGYGVDEVTSQQVNAVADDYSSLDQNLPGNVTGRGGLVTRRGKRGTYAYRATQPGIQAAREALQRLLEGEEGVEV